MQSAKLTQAQAVAEIETWGPHNPIHVGWGWHNTEYGDNALLRLLAAAGADLRLLTTEAGYPCFMVNGCIVDAFGELRDYAKGLTECERVIGVDYRVLLAMMEASERFTRFDARREVMDFVTDYQAGTSAMKEYVRATLLPLLPAANRAVA